MLYTSLILLQLASINLMWDPNTDEIDGYNVYRKEQPTYDWAQIATLPCEPNDQECAKYTDEVPPFTRFHYVVSAFRNELESGSSNEINYRVVCRGDANLDGNISISDAALIQRHIVGLVSLEEEALRAADANRDGNVTISDVTLVLRAIVGLVDLECQ